MYEIWAECLDDKSSNYGRPILLETTDERDEADRAVQAYNTPGGDYPTPDWVVYVHNDAEIMAQLG